jgi:hypothetical protein
MSTEINAALIERLGERLPAHAAYLVLYLRSKAQERGENTLLTSQTKLAFAVGMNRDHIRRALQRLVRQGFISIDNAQGGTLIHVHNIDKTLSHVKNLPKESPGHAQDAPIDRPGENGSGEPSAPIRKARTTFQAPSWKEVEEYAKSIAFNLSGEEFCDFYESKGWMIGKNPMKNWKAAVRTWRRKGYVSPNQEPKPMPLPKKYQEQVPKEEDLVQPEDIHDLVIKLAGGAKRLP